MKRPMVYLAGPIAGKGYDTVTRWREIAHNVLLVRDVETLDPMRAKQALAGAVIATDYRGYADRGVFFTSAGIMMRDFTDVQRADALLVNLLDCRKPTLGTVMELAWAYAFQKPAVVIMEPEGNPHDGHPMIAAATSFRVETLDEGIDAVAVILNR